MMQAGRELDVKVAEALGYQGVKYGKDELGEYAYMISSKGYSLGKTIHVPRFSTTWEGMGVLVEEAKKQGIAFRVETRFIDGSFFDYQCLASNGQTFGMATSGTAPYAACLALLKVKGVAV